jgi:hypothetical protein
MIINYKKGAKQTVDFRACRDLNGRRLRHVNDEIIYNKWKAAKEGGVEFDVDQDTAAGIPLWFLSTPSWYYCTLLLLLLLLLILLSLF